MQNIDEKDLEILRILQENSDITTKELSGKINLSPTPVYERVKKLEKEGYIQKYVAVLDKDKMEKNLTAFCNVTLRQHTAEIGNKFVNDIISLSPVTACYNVSGDYDFLLKVVVSDMKSYQDFVLNQLGAIDNIGNVHSTFVMGEIKNTHSLPI